MAASSPVPRVLHVAETAQGGVGSYLEDLAALEAERYGADSLHVVMPREDAARFKRLPAQALRPFERAGAGRVLSLLRLAVHTLREIRRWRPQVVHLHSSYAGFVLRPLIALLPMRAVGALLPARPVVVYCAHGWAFDRRVGLGFDRPVARIERWWSRWCDATVCTSQHDFDSALRIGIDAQRLTVIAHGVPDAVPAGEGPAPLGLWRRHDLRVLFAGQLERKKGADAFVGAMRRLGDRVDLSAVVVGASAVAGTDAADTPPSMRLVGQLPREQLPAYYAAADIVVVPSRWEGYGLVAVEAMRAGRAVVASDMGGFADVVEHGVTGLLIEPDSADALAAALASLNIERVRAMGRAGRARFERRFRLERVADELEALYRRLLQARRDGGPQPAAGGGALGAH